MENQEYIGSYREFEKINKDFCQRFPHYEEIRLKMLQSFMIRAFLYFILFPSIVIIFVAKFFSGMKLSYADTMVLLFYVSSFAVFSPIVLKNKYFIVVPIIFLFLLSTVIKGTALFQAVIATAILLEIAMYIKLFLNYKEKWNRKFTNLLKSENMNSITKKIGNIDYLNRAVHQELSYFKPDYVIDDEIKKSDLFMDFNSRKTDDEFKGEYKNVPFSVSETALYKIKENDNCEDKIFKGIIIKFEINKIVSSRTIVSAKYDKISQNNPAINFLVVFLMICIAIFGIVKIHSVVFALIWAFMFYDLIVKKENIYKKSNFQKVVLEDEKFNKIYNAYSSDQVEARYLLTTSFMERFKNIQTAFGANFIKCSFCNRNKLIISISTNKDLFEIGSLFKSVYDKELLKNFYRELSSIYYLIDYFKLDEKTML